jgi:hypothetical protein
MIKSPELYQYSWEESRALGDFRTMSARRHRAKYYATEDQRFLEEGLERRW